MRLAPSAEVACSSAGCRDVHMAQPSSRRIRDGAHSLGNRSSAFSGRQPVALLHAERSRRSSGAQLCSAMMAPGTLPQATMVGPSRGARGTEAAPPPQQQAQLRLDERELRQQRGGQESEDYAMRLCVELHEQHIKGQRQQIPSQAWEGGVLDEAYERAGVVTAEWAKTFYLGTKLMTPEKARAVWAIYVWCRRTDELVDGPNASRITPEALDRWEERLEGIFAGRPYDILDAALTDTVTKYPVHIQPFRDMIDGMRMDLVKSRYQTYDELYGYCYKVAGTVALMTTPVMGINPAYDGPLENVYKAALALGTANQLTNILRDVGEDVNERNRIYVPLDELEQFSIAESDVVSGMFAATTGKIDDRWRRFMEFQIGRTRQIFADAEAGVDQLAPDARLPVWSALILYRQILDGIEKNDYDNFTKRAYVPKWKKFLSLPRAFLRAQEPQALLSRSKH